MLPFALLGLAACSGGGHSSPTSSPASATPRPATIPVGGSSEGGLCKAAQFRLLPQPAATRQAQRLVARMSLAQETEVMHGVGLGGANGAVGSTAPILALGIPALNQEDGPGGIGDGTTGVTQLPAPIALAATFDPAAARCYGQVIGEEARAKGIELMYGPTVNLVRVPQWGRAFESLGEDPVLSGTIGHAEIIGTQRAGVMAEAKHFTVYNQETNRNTAADNAIVSDRVLHELYLKLWGDIATAHPAAVMCSYSTINSRPACQDRPLLHGFLDRLPGFHGFIGADFNALKQTVPAAKAGLDQEQPTDLHFGKQLIAAVHGGQVPRTVVDQAATRIVAQLCRFRLLTDYPTPAHDRVVATPQHDAVGARVAEESTVLLKNADHVLPLASHGSVAVIGPAAAADTAASGAGTAYVVPPSTVSPIQGMRTLAPSGVAVSYTAGLPTASQLIPIPATDLSPAYPPHGTGGPYSATLTAPTTGTYVIGLNSNRYFSSETLTIDGRVVFDNPDSTPPLTYTAAVHLEAGQKYRLEISSTSNALTWATPSMLQRSISAAAAAAAKADTAVVVVADPQESEAVDRTTLSLPSAQDELVSAVAAANPHTVVVVQAGAAITMPWLPDVAGVIDQWYPGQSDGDTMTRVLFGEVNPSGHLPVSFPRSDSVTPVARPRQFPGVGGTVQYSEGLNIGYRWWIDERRQPLFPFGFGLSYSPFRYGRPRVSTRLTPSGPIVQLREHITNTGSRSGADVAQLYIGIPAAGEPARQLAAYRRVSLAAGASTSLTMRLRGMQLATFNAGRWQIPAGSYHLYVGDSSATGQLRPAVRFRLSRAYFPAS
jgi:beta-glucosidase